MLDELRDHVEQRRAVDVVRRRAVLVAIVHVEIAVLDGGEERRAAPEAGRIDVGAAFEQQIDDAELIVQERHQQRPYAVGLGLLDVGAGGGWFTIRLANRVGPNGVVYAQDIQPEMIGAISRRVEREGLKNVKTVLGAADDPQLPAPVDVVLIVDAYHEMDDPRTLLRKLRTSLKRGGRIGIVEFTKNGYGPGPPMEDRVDAERVIRDAQAAGLKLESRGDFLRYQYLLEFVADGSTK